MACDFSGTIFYYVIFDSVVIFPVILSLQRLLAVLDELESLKPEFKRQVDELNDLHAKTGLAEDNGSNRALQSSGTSSLEWPPVCKSSSLSVDLKQVRT